MYRIEYLNANEDVVRVAYETGLHDALKHTDGSLSSLAFKHKQAVSIQSFEGNTADAVGWDSALCANKVGRPHYYHFDWQ